MKKNNLLATTCLDLNLPNKTKKAILGDWVLKMSLKRKMSITQKYHWNDNVKRKKDYKYIINLYEKILKKLRFRMNKYFKIKKSEIYWRIILGPWLMYYLMVNFDRWEVLKKCYKKKVKYSVSEFIQANNSTICSDTIEFIKKSEQSNFFNHALFLRIIKFHYIKKTKILKINKKTYNGGDLYFENTLKAIRDKSKKNNLLYKIFAYFALRYNKIIFDNFNYPKKEFIDLCSRFAILPLKLGNYFEKYDFQSLKVNPDRKKIFDNLIKPKNYFEKYLNEFIGKDLPQSLFEAIPLIKDKTKKISKKRLILTMYSFFHNDFFKIWLAESVENGSKLIVSDHGAGLNAFFDLDREHYAKISDKFIKFNKTFFSNKDKIMSPMLDVISQNFENSKGKNCTIIDLDTALYPVKIISMPYASEKKKIFKDHVIFTKKLDKKVFKKIKFRIAGNHLGFSEAYSKKFGISKLSLIQKASEDSSAASFIKKLQNNIFDDFKKSKIIVCCYPQTPFFEAMYTGIPTILFCKYKYFEMKKDSCKIFNILKDSKIAFEDPTLASNHINKYWNNLEEWWLSDKTIQARKFFLQNFYSVKKNWKSEWYNFIKREYNKISFL